MASVVLEQAMTSSMSQALLQTSSNADIPATDISPESGFLLYPNPSGNGVFNITLPENSISYILKIFSTDGRQVHQAELTAGQNTYRFSIAGLARGTYMLGVYKKANR